MFVPRVTRVTAPVEFREYRPWTWVQLAVVALAIGALAGVAWRLFLSNGRYGDDEYRLWRWEADHIVGTFFRIAGIDGGEHAGEGETLRLYFGYTSQIRAEMGHANPDLGLVEVLTSERAVYARDIERIIAGQVEDAIDEAGLLEHLPFFNQVSITWPPVSFKVTGPPQLLVTSPRNQIERSGSTLLRTGLTSEDVERLEAETDSADEVSLVVAIGGLAAYPAFVRDDGSYRATVETAAHEWVHHYVAFYPLGQTWGTSETATILNETTANVAGRELGALVQRLDPIAFPPGTDGNLPVRRTTTIDFNGEMRNLRLSVDALLAEGRVPEAEALMEETRRRLADNGIVIRKINQAYFAFYGSYGDLPASSNPVGKKVERVWQLTGDVRTFLEVMRDVTSKDELDEAIAKLEAVTKVAQRQ